MILKETSVLQEILNKLNKDIDESLNDAKSFEGHSAMKKLIEKYKNIKNVNKL